MSQTQISKSKASLLLLIFLPLIAAMAIGAVYISLDVHYSVLLTDDFTKNGISDENNFGIIMGEEPAGNNLSISQLDYYKKVIVPYNSESGDVKVEFTEPKDSHIIGFMNEMVNSTNYTSSFSYPVDYSVTENITALYSHTISDITYNETESDITESLFSIEDGYLLYSELYNNEIFESPSIDWEIINFNQWWYESWSPDSRILGKTMTKLYLPFRFSDGIVKSGFVYVQIYNSTQILSTKTFGQYDFYDPFYSVFNVLCNPITVYSPIFIKVFTSLSYFTGSNLQVGAISPNNTVSTFQYAIDILGFEFFTNEPGECFFKGVVIDQNFVNNPIYSTREVNGGGFYGHVAFNLTFNLGDFGVTVANMINFSLNVNDFFISVGDGQIDAQTLSFYNFDSDSWEDFSSAHIENKTYGLYTVNNLNYVSPSNQIFVQLNILGDNVDFYATIRDINFSIWFIDTYNTTWYYSTYTLSLDGGINGEFSLESILLMQKYGYLYTETSTQYVLLNLTLTMTTPFYIITKNILYTTEVITNRRTVYYLYNEQSQNPFDIQMNYYKPEITVFPYKEGMVRKVDVGGQKINVFI